MVRIPSLLVGASPQVEFDRNIKFLRGHIPNYEEQELTLCRPRISTTWSLLNELEICEQLQIPEV